MKIKENFTITCGIILEDVDTGKFLMCHPTNSAPNIWSIPKGYKDDNETLIKAAARELIEETGIDITKIPFNIIEEFELLKYPNSTKHLKAFHFTIQAKSIKNTLICESMVHWKDKESFPEVDNHKWFTINEILNLKITPTQRVVFERIQKKK